MRRWQCWAFLSAFSMIQVFPAFGLPAQVVILRHAEKPAEGNHLSPKGLPRARALVGFWESHPVTRAYGKPAAFYACHSPGKSLRSVETLAPSAEFYRKTVLAHHAKDQTRLLAQEILGRPELRGRTVIVAWQHSNIIPLLSALGVPHPPSEWPDEVFNQIAVVRFGAEGPPHSRLYPQCVLPGDCDSQQ